METDFEFSWPIPRGSGPIDVRFDCVSSPPANVDLSSDPAVHSVVTNQDAGWPSIAYHRFSGLDVVRIRDVADHYIWSDHIVCHLHDPSLRYLVEIQLLGFVLAVWLERRGVPALHASVVVIDGSAVAFLGTKGGGKTTAATGLVAAGASLLVDDLLALVPCDDQILAQPGYPMLRLWPDQADHFLGSHGSLPLVHPAYSKRRIIVGQGFGSFHDQPAPLRCLYLPLRDRDASTATFEPLRARDGVFAMVRESFLRDAVHGLGLAPTRLPALAHIVERVETRRVRFPTGFDQLPALAEAVMDDVASLEEPPGG